MSTASDYIRRAIVRDFVALYGVFYSGERLLAAAHFVEGLTPHSDFKYRGRDIHKMTIDELEPIAARLQRECEARGISEDGIR